MHGTCKFYTSERNIFHIPKLFRFSSPADTTRSRSVPVDAKRHFFYPADANRRFSVQQSLSKSSVQETPPSTKNFTMSACCTHRGGCYRAHAAHLVAVVRRATFYSSSAKQPPRRFVTDRLPALKRGRETRRRWRRVRRRCPRVSQRRQLRGGSAAATAAGSCLSKSVLDQVWVKFGSRLNQLSRRSGE